MEKPIKYKFSNGQVYVRSGKSQEWKKVYSFNTKSESYSPINQFFGENKVSFYKDLGMKGHNGIDWFAPDGTCLYASITGEVAWVSTVNDNGYGKAIILISDEDDGKATAVIYGHLQDIYVRVGDLVREGDLIGLCDNTGKYTTGSHLHEGVIKLERMKGGLTQYWLRPEYGYKYDNGYLGYSDHLPLIGEYKIMSSDKYEKKIVQRVDTVNGGKGQCYWVEDGNWKFLDSEKNPITRHIPLVDKVLEIMNKGIPIGSYVAITEKEFAPFKDNIIQ